jgi:hypothetical protein
MFRKSNQRFKNAAQLRQHELDKKYKKRSLIIMEQDFSRADTADTAVVADQKSFAKRQIVAEEAGGQRKARAEHGYSWEDYMAELREKYAGKEDFFCNGVIEGLWRIKR